MIAFIAERTRRFCRRPPFRASLQEWFDRHGRFDLANCDLVAILMLKRQISMEMAMTKKARFTMRLAEFKEGISYTKLSFRRFIDDAEGTRVLSDPVISPMVSDSMEYGSLFAYLFRRFGYPNCGWDNYKELAKYVLTTPHPELLMDVTPYAGGATCITFKFFVPRETVAAVESYDERAFRAWEQRAFSWRKQQGLPDWMEGWIRLVNETLRPSWASTGPNVNSWSDSLRYATSPGAPGNDQHEIRTRATEFRQAIYVEYRKIEPEPVRVRRGEDWKQWESDDPLKPLAEAAQIALSSLRRPVRVRDIAINALGEVASSSKVLKEALVAGYPSGAIGNGAPAEFADLQGLIIRLGKGNARKGIAKLLKAAKECA